MNLVAKCWALLRTWTLGDWLWRASVVLAPWQTRWFLEGPMVQASGWEQGRISVYASMLVVVALIGYVVQKEGGWRRYSWKHGLVALIVGCVVLVPTLSLRASLQWMVQGACVIGWAWALVHLATKDQLSDWLLIALLPPLVFGLWQVAAQVVPASTILGVAGQDPARLGVSVVQVGAERFLRAYGSFPHPNIFGGWLAMGLLMTWWRSGTQRSLLGVLPGLSLGLYLSFSRSAWMAVAVGAIILCFSAWKTKGIRHWLRGAVLIGLTFCMAILARPELLYTRLQASTRLEVKSINERVVSLEQAWGVMRLHPFGTGVGGYRLGLADVCSTWGCDVSTEPPHLAPVLMVAEFGLLRMIFVLVGICLLAWKVRFRTLVQLVLVSPLVVLAFLDHYLWSLWAGQTLAALVFAVFWLYQHEKNKRMRCC